MADRGRSTTFSCNAVLGSLRQDARDFIFERGELRHMSAGDVIFEQGAAVTHAVFPLEGVISYVVANAGDRQVETISVGREGVIGLGLFLEKTTTAATSVTQVPGRALWLSKADFDFALEKFPCMRTAMVHYLEALIIQMMEIAACNSLHTAEQRVSRWLLQAHDRVAGDEFMVTQEGLAHLLALRRATVNAACSNLMHIGAISYNRGRLTVKDRSLLHAQSCDCYDRISKAFTA